MLKYILIAVLAYLIGSFSMSIIISRYLFHDDVRNHGSGNAGATNVARTFGWGPGILTFLTDFAKCIIAMLIGRKLGGEWGFTVAGMFCLIGHCFPVYFKFKGGKAVSTGACVALLVDWRVFLISIGVFIVMALVTKIVSVSSVTASVVMIVLMLLLVSSTPLKVLGVFTGLLIIFMHRENIVRLIQGKEGKFKAGKRAKDDPEQGAGQ